MTDLEAICYDKLREIGVSVETADSLAPILASLTPKKRRAFMLWAMGFTTDQIENTTGVTRWALLRLIRRTRTKCL